MRVLANLYSIVIVGSVFGVAAHAADSYKLTDLSALIPQANAGFKINNVDQLMSTANGDGVSLPKRYTIIYSKGTVMRIDTPISTDLLGASLNDAGDVAGTYLPSG